MTKGKRRQETPQAELYRDSLRAALESEALRDTVASLVLRLLTKPRTPWAFAWKHSQASAVMRQLPDHVLRDLLGLLTCLIGPLASYWDPGSWELMGAERIARSMIDMLVVAHATEEGAHVIVPWWWEDGDEAAQAAEPMVRWTAFLSEFTPAKFKRVGLLIESMRRVRPDAVSAATSTDPIQLARMLDALWSDSVFRAALADYFAVTPGSSRALVEELHRRNPTVPLSTLRPFLSRFKKVYQTACGGADLVRQRIATVRPSVAMVRAFSSGTWTSTKYPSNPKKAARRSS